MVPKGNAELLPYAMKMFLSCKSVSVYREGAFNIMKLMFLWDAKFG
jgi:hypothetical protein